MIVTHSGTDVQASVSNRENYRKEKEREKGNIPEKRKEGARQASGTPLGFYKKKACTFGNFQGSESSANTRFKGEANPAKRLLDRDGNERKYFCRRCKRNHPGKDCDGIWLSVIFATKGDIGSMNATLRKGVEVNSRVGNTGSRIQTTPEGKSICSTEMVIMVMRLKGFFDLLMEDKTGLKNQECQTVGVTLGEEWMHRRLVDGYLRLVQEKLTR